MATLQESSALTRSSDLAGSLDVGARREYESELAPSTRPVPIGQIICLFVPRREGSLSHPSRKGKKAKAVGDHFEKINAADAQDL